MQLRGEGLAQLIDPEQQPRLHRGQRHRQDQGHIMTGDRAGGARRALADHPAAARAGAQDSLPLEQLQGRAEGRPADSQLPGQLAFTGQFLSRRKGQEMFAEHLGGLRDERWSFGQLDHPAQAVPGPPPGSTENWPNTFTSG